MKDSRLLKKNTDGTKKQILPKTHEKSVINLTEKIEKTISNNGIPTLKSLTYDRKTISEISKTSFEFLLAPRVVRNAVLQSIMFDSNLGQWFIGQTDVSSPQGFTITRTDATGNMLSQMYFKEGGHGSSVFYISRDNQTPLVFFQDHDVYRVTEYIDNTTITPDQAEISFKPPVNGNGMASYHKGVMVHINNTTDDLMMSVYKYRYDETNKKFWFPDNIYQQFDLKEILANEINVLQGLTIMSKDEITGHKEDEDKYLILAMGGFPDVEFTIVPFEYYPETNTLKRMATIDGVEKMFKPSLAKNNIDWGEGYEPEGLFPIRINYGYGNDEHNTGLAIGISAGIGGKRKNYVMGLLNNYVSNFMTSANNAFANTKNTEFVRNDLTKLYEITTPGVYEVKRGDLQRMVDAPSNWRYVDSFSDWTLEVLPNNQHGDVVQILTKRSLNAQIEVYKRVLDYNADEYGFGFGPHQIGPWNIVKMDGQMSMIISATNNGMTKKMSDFNVPGTAYYISSGKTALITDWEGADEIVQGRGFRIEVSSFGGAADQLLQKIFVPKSGIMTIAYRNIPATRETYGPGLIATLPITSSWSVFNGTIVS